MKVTELNPSQTPGFLFLDDSAADVKFLSEFLRIKLHIDFAYQQAATNDALETALLDRTWDIVLCDFSMPGLTAPDAIQTVKAIQPQTPIILVSDTASLQDAVDMMRLGACAFVEKGDHDRLLEIVRQELGTSRSYQKTTASEPPLQPSTAFYHSIVDAQTELICRYDADLRLTFMNRAYCEWQKRPAQALIGTSIFDSITVEDRDQAAAHIRALNVENPVTVSVHSATLPNGTVQITEWTDRAIFDAAGNLVEYQGVGRDVTDRYRVIEALRARETRLQWLVDSQTNYVVRTNLQGYYTYFNKKFIEEYGQVYGEEGLIGGYALDSICEYHHQRTQETVEKCIAQPNKVFQVNLDKPHINGTIRTTLWEFTCLLNQSGEPSEIQCIGIDITQQTQAQATVQHQTNLLQQVSDAIIVTDNDLKITSWNKAATEIYGWTEAEAIGREMDELLRTEWFAESQSSAQASVAHSGHWRGEIRQTTKQGDQRYVLAGVTLLNDSSGEQIGGITVNCDITSLKRRGILQERISQTLEMVAARQQLPAILEKLVQSVEEFEPNIRASVLLVDPKVSQLRHGAAPSLPDAYNAAIDGISIGSGIGSCGTAAHEKRLVIVNDIFTDPLWKDFKNLAAEHGLRACWSQPIFGHDERVLGTFALYYADTRQPSTDELDLIRLAGRIAGLVIEHAQSQAALRESEEKYRSLVESADAAIAVFDTNGNLQFANEIAAIQLGISPEAMVGKDMRALFPPDVADYQLKSIRDVIRTGQGSVTEAPSFLSAGDRWYRTSIQPIRNASGQITMALIHASDITQFKAAELTLRQTEKRYRQMFELQNLPKLIIHPQTARILDANSAAVDHYGYSLETLKSMTIMQINVTEPQVIQEKIRQILAKEINSCLFRQRLADGSIRDVEVYATEIELEGQTVLYSTYIDITERNRALAALEDANQQLEQRVHERTRALEQSKDRIEAIFNHSGDGILLLDTALKIKQCNYACGQMFAAAEDAFYGKPLFDLMSQEDRATLEAQLPDVVLRHETKQLAIRGKRLDGTAFDAEISIAPVNRSEKAVENLVCIFRDVTELKRAEKAIAEERNLLRTVIDAVPDFIYVKDTDHRMLLNNAAHARSLNGISAKDVIGKTDFELFPAELAAKFYADEQRLFETQHSVISTEERSIGVDGSEIWALTTKVPLRNLQGDLIGLVGITHDVTQIKANEESLRRSEQRLRESENMLQLVLDTIPVRVFWKDTNSVYMGCNRLYAEDAGLPDTDSVVGKSDLDMPWATSVAEAYRRDDKAIIESGIPKLNFVEPRLTAEGQAGTLQTSKIPLRDANNQIIGLLGTYFDITEQKEAEAQLRYLASMQEFMHDSVIGTDMEFRIQGWNRASEAMFGWTAAEAIGNNLFVLLGFEFVGLTLEDARQAVMSNGSWTGEVTARHRSGQPIYILGSVALNRDEQGKPVGLTGVNHDFTRRKEAEAALARQREAEQEMQRHLAALHTISLRLTRTQNLDDFYRLVVEKGLSELGFERMGLLLHDAGSGDAVGTYGTDAHGKVVAEHHLRLAPDSLTGILQRTLVQSERLAFDEDALLYANLMPLTRGQNAASALWNGKLLGWLTIDNAVQGKPITQAQLDVLALYALTVGSLLARKEAEIALAESEKRYRLIADHISDVIVEYEITGICTYISPSVQSTLGYHEDEIIGHTMNDFVFPDDIGISEAIAMKAMAEGKREFRATHRILHKEGFNVWSESNHRLILDESGMPMGGIAVFRDITERKTAEAQIRSMTERLQLATEAGGIGIWDWNTQTNVLLWDNQMYRLYGINNENFTGTFDAWEKSLHPEDALRSQAEVEAALRGEERFDTEFRIVTPDGDVRHIRGQANVYRDNNNTVYRMIGVNIDITKQKTVELALRESEEKFRLFIEAAPIATIIINADSDVVLVNGAALMLFEFEREELLGESIQILVPDEIQAHRQFYMTGNSDRLAKTGFSARRKNGQIFPADIHLSRVQIDDEALVMVIVMDITQQKQAEEKLRVTLEKEKELGELKSQFITTASHQFRTPLAAILAATETLTILRNRLDDSQIDTRLDRIRNQVNRMKRLMDDVLELSRIQAKQIQYRPKRAALDVFVHEVIEEFAHQNDYHSRLVYEGPITPIITEFDPHLMHHILNNLIHNALKYSEKLVYVYLTQAKDEIVFTVKDHGIGIPSSELSRLFIPFNRASNTGAIEGTGLGLSIVKQSVKAHGGSIDVESTIGSGTVVTVKLPYDANEGDLHG
ncbi:MAG: PAS domain S-box protein [Chloroflexota bacterium]|nr:PAS domain S-box protein [Chloroflexota bacterium]